MNGCNNENFDKKLKGVVDAAVFVSNFKKRGSIRSSKTIEMEGGWTVSIASEV